VKVAMLSGLHLTATQKRHIGQLVEQKLTEGGTKALGYKITAQRGDVYDMIVSKRDSNDRGQTFWRRGNYTVRVTA
jgi:hypothetical protein